MEFIEEAKEWLKPFGYSVHSYNPSGFHVTLVYQRDLEDMHYPTITCWLESGQPKCQLDYPGLKMFISLQTPELQFKHPDIERFIKVMHHYAIYCEHFNPFNMGI